MKYRFSYLEAGVFQLIAWLGFWLINDYLAALLTLILGCIVFVILVIALLSEAIEQSKVPKSYFYHMGIGLLAIFLAAGIYVTILGGSFDFLEKNF
jgi:hypothetical protein